MQKLEKNNLENCLWAWDKFEHNVWYLKRSDLDEILHGGSKWCKVPAVKVWYKSVNFKGGNNIIFR